MVAIGPAQTLSGERKHTPGLLPYVRDKEHTVLIYRWALNGDIFLVEKWAKGLMGNSHTTNKQVAML